MVQKAWCFDGWERREGEEKRKRKRKRKEKGVKDRPQCHKYSGLGSPAQLLEALAATEDGQALQSAHALPALHHVVPAELPTVTLFLSICIYYSRARSLPYLKLCLEDGVFMCCAREAVLQGTSSQCLMYTQTYPHLSAAFPQGTGMVFLSIIKKNRDARR